ncbi:hypothetical protein FF38_04594 [Lucilia cuprina]|uniref:Uncharacterized protein n=1 Tax=Lucilia cuprina TaxID=7375 RepID=A0A0L0BWE8_LUCCU|nr:hypothetical protein FF38_04594 [Lucilia cuprina]
MDKRNVWKKWEQLKYSRAMQRIIGTVLTTVKPSALPTFCENIEVKMAVTAFGIRFLREGCISSKPIPFFNSFVNSMVYLAKALAMPLRSHCGNVAKNISSQVQSKLNFSKISYCSSTEAIKSITTAIGFPVDFSTAINETPSSAVMRDNSLRSFLACTFSGKLIFVATATDSLKGPKENVDFIAFSNQLIDNY